MSPENDAQNSIEFVTKDHCPYPRETTEDRIVAAIIHDILDRAVIKRNWETMEKEVFDDILETWRIIIRKTLNDPDYAIAQEKGEPAIANSPTLDLKDYLCNPLVLQTRDGVSIKSIRRNVDVDDFLGYLYDATLDDSNSSTFTYWYTGYLFTGGFLVKETSFDLILRKEAEPNDNPRLVAISSGGVLADAILDTETGEVRTIKEVIEDFRNVPLPDHWQDRPEEETELGSRHVWDEGVVQRIKELANPPAIKNYIRLRASDRLSKVWVITNFVDDSLFAGLVEAGFAQKEDMENALEAKEYLFEICSPNYEKILRELADNLTPYNGSYGGESTLPPYNLFCDR